MQAGTARSSPNGMVFDMVVLVSDHAGVSLGTIS